MDTLKYIEIKAPKSLNDLRIQHLEALTNDKFKQNNLNLEDILKFISIVTTATLNELKKVNLSELKEVYSHCIGIFSEYKITEPQQEIELLGVTYELINPKKVGVGWHIDVSNSDIKKEPARLAALMYIEKGTNYGDLDQNGNMVHSNQDRQKIFEKHLPLPIYLNLVSFFLRKSIELISNSTESPKIRKTVFRNLLAIRGKR